MFSILRKYRFADGTILAMSFSPVSVLFGGVLGACLVGVVLLFANEKPAERFRHSGRALMGTQTMRHQSGDRRSFLQEPLWQGVLPDNIIDQQLPTVRNPHYGMHVIALGKNGSLFHKYQTGLPNMSDPMPIVPMTEWRCLTPATYKNTSGVELPLIFGNSPAIALNGDGRIELFVGFQADSLDLWQMYQTDAKNPLAWSKPRAPYCDPSFPDCQKCLAKPECKAGFWSDGYTWTTSQQSLWLHPSDNKLRLTWRNFDGHLYEKTQQAPSSSEHWTSDALQYAIFE